MAETVIVPPYSEMVIPGVVQGETHFTEGVIENIESALCDGHVALAKLVVNPAGGDVPLRVVNMGYQSAKLYEGMIIASCEPAHVMSMVEEESSDNDLNSEIVKVEHELPSYMSPVLDEYEHRLSRMGGSDDVTGMSGSVGKTRTDGADAGTELCRSDDVATMVDTGGRTAADESGCGIIMGQSDGDTGTGNSDGVTEMDVSDGESRMGRSDRGTGMGGSGEGRQVCGSAVGTRMGRLDNGTGTGGSDGVTGTSKSDGGTGMSRSLGLGVKTGGSPVQVQSDVSSSSTVQPGVSHSPANTYVSWSPDVIASIPPRQSSIVCCVTDPELPLDLSQQPRESPRVLMGSAARWQEDQMRKDHSGDIPIKPSQAWPKIMSSVMDIQQDSLPLMQDYRPLQNDPAFFSLVPQAIICLGFRQGNWPTFGKGPGIPKVIWVCDMFPMEFRPSSERRRPSSLMGPFISVWLPGTKVLRHPPHPFHNATRLGGGKLIGPCRMLRGTEGRRLH